jgi:TP53 regulating kinase-like protein
VLIRKGAEAELFLENWYGLKVIRKARKVKAYRLPKLDLEIRRSRTGREAQIMHDAKVAGVPTPMIFMVDVEATTIIMGYVEGELVKECLHDLSPVERVKLCRRLGRLIGRLHENKIIHGDLTTSNMILTEGGKIFLIDFGLAEYSEELEERGVDLLLLKRAFYSTHFTCAKECFEAVIDGYAEEMGEEACREVVERVEKIAKRGRYTFKG